jgi:hypothetical protein
MIPKLVAFMLKTQKTLIKKARHGGTHRQSQTWEDEPGLSQVGGKPELQRKTTSRRKKGEQGELRTFQVADHLLEFNP